ncbi:MAG: DUF255 domain-containing protein [Bacteroidetes bacterium]|nr:DUF255 domain-containing protein [Bacteroidota bacterium]
MRNLLFVAAIASIGILFTSSFKGKEASTPHIKWMTMKEALAASKKNPKKIIVDVYTDWCGWCKKMDKATYENPKIIANINKNYYAVKFNAEREEDVEYMGKMYKMPQTGGRATHELAVYMLQGQMSYPSTLILNDDNSIIQNIPGYIEADMMNTVLSYFGGNHHKTTAWDAFQKNFKN